MRLLALFLTLLLVPVRAAEPPERVRKLANDVRWLVNQNKKHMRCGVAIVHIPSGERVEVDAAAPYPLASVFKLPIMVELARQVQAGEAGFNLDTQLTVTEDVKCIGSGRLKSAANGSKVSVAKCVDLMMNISDNTATDMLFERVGLDSVNQTMHGWGLKSTDIFMTNRQAWLLSLGLGPGLEGLSPVDMARRWLSWEPAKRRAAAREVGKKYRGLTLREFQRLEDDSRRSNTHSEDAFVAAAMDNLCSPADTADLLAGLAQGKLLDARRTDYCLDVLSRQQFNTRIPSKLPAHAQVYHKTGTLAGIVNDAGLVRLDDGGWLAIAVYTRDVAAGQEGAAERLIGTITRLAYDRY